MRGLQKKYLTQKRFIIIGTILVGIALLIMINASTIIVHADTEQDYVYESIKVMPDDSLWSISKEYCPDNIDINEYNTREKLLSVILEKGIELESETDIGLLGFGNLVDLLYKKVARPKMVEPVFLVEHPIELSPLARANDENPNLTDRFQLVINGAEIINAYSELVDPIEQMKRLEEQAKLNSEGDEEAMVMDMDYIEAMEYGMPPISGWGMGIDRVMQVLTGVPNIKDNILFPLLRPLDNKED